VFKEKTQSNDDGISSINDAPEQQASRRTKDLASPQKGRKIEKAVYEEYEEHELVYVVDEREEIVPKETTYMIPEWFDIDKIPYHQMPEDDAHWYPSILNESYMRGIFQFDGVKMEKKKVWNVPHIMLSLLDKITEGDMRSYTKRDLQYLCVCMGVKEPGIGWANAAPPTGKNSDMIRALLKADNDHQQWCNHWFQTRSGR